ncbi:MAG: sugar kinase [Opitutales bacterium]
MNTINLKSKEETKFDILSLGEVMLRLDPTNDRIRTARSFRAWEGGGEYNVARGMAKCFRQRATVVTALAENEVGYLIADFIAQGAVDTSFLKWAKADGAGRNVRNGLNFTERGFGIRGALGCSDRANSAASQLKVGDIDWEEIFGKQGVRWFHTGGIFAALSETTSQVVIEAVKVAKKYGTIVSYDLNYRPSLWADIGGQAKAIEVNSEIAKYVDVMIGNEEDFTACLGLEVEGMDEHISQIDVEAFKNMINNAVKKFPNFKATATTLRKVSSASLNDWSAICWHNGEFFESKKRENLEIYDRVGGGDSFASGFIYGLMELQNPQLAVDYGAAHGALAMTTPGDTSTARLEEVSRLAQTNATARVIR